MQLAAPIIYLKGAPYELDFGTASISHTLEPDDIVLEYKMGKHYIPQYYLQGFTNKNTGKIWSYEKTTGRTFSSKLTNIAQGSNYNTQDTENHLTYIIENPANKVIDKIKKYKTLSKKDKETFSNYLIAIHIRVPEGKKRVSQIAPNLLDENIEKITRLFEILKVPEQKKNELEELKEKLSSDDRFYKYFINNIWEMQIKNFNLIKSTNAVNQMTWSFLYSNNSVFCTSDNPFFYFKHRGLGNSDSEFSFPISDRIVLIGKWDTKKQYRYKLVEAKEIIEFNNRMAFNCSKFIFFSKNDSKFTELIKKDMS